MTTEDILEGVIHIRASLEFHGVTAERVAVHPDGYMEILKLAAVLAAPGCELFSRRGPCLLGLPIKKDQRVPRHTINVGPDGWPL